MANVLSIVSYKIFPAKLGGQKGIALFNEYFSGYHNLFCVTIKNNDPSFASYKVFNLLSNSRFRYINIFYFGLIKKIIKENKISHIILEHPYYGWLAILLKYFCKIKVIVHSHNIEAERFKTLGKWWWKILWHYEKFVHNKADFTFCISQADRDYIYKNYKTAYERSSVITYGISWNIIPSIIEKEIAKDKLFKEYLFLPGTFLFLFNGTLNYGPNLDAVKNIVDKINPLFIKKGINYKIIICGKGLPEEMNELKEYANRNIIYAGFVDDITTYFLGADVFVNPVTDGGGIKTKLVEALGYDLNVVSTSNGAIGVEENICNHKLLLCGNNDWQGFADAMEKASKLTQSIKLEFFDHFYWENIAKKAADLIKN
ncbi:MAG: glycosyltransferase family 4 protein [Bacteroidota bacterium]|nr:glycosyltransferase family 4 protein [Bacteroidota bacterium]